MGAIILKRLLLIQIYIRINKKTVTYRYQMIEVTRSPESVDERTVQFVDQNQLRIAIKKFLNVGNLNVTHVNKEKKML